MAWQRIASVSEIGVDGILGLDVDGSPVALYRLASEVFATAGICTHALAVLSDGFVEDGKIECPLHQGQFDIRSGKALCAPVTEDLRTYAVKLEGDDVFIDMERPAASAQVVANVAPYRKAGGAIRPAEEDNEAGIREIAAMNIDPAAPDGIEPYPDEDQAFLLLYDSAVFAEFEQAIDGMLARGVPQSKVRTVRATSPAFIARKASLMSDRRPVFVTIASRSSRPWR